MKKSRIVKFALLGASTAALVGTLSTATYAWYVANPSVTAKNMKAGTASTGGDGSISISSDGLAGHWYKSIDLSANGKNVLVPVHSTDGLSFKQVDGTSAAASGSWLTYSFYVAADSDGTFTYSIQAKGQTKASEVTKQTFLLDDTLTSSEPTGISKGQSFAMDAAKALYMSVTTTPGVMTSGAYAAASPASAATTKIHAVSGGTSPISYTAATDAGYNEGGNANTYYNEVMGVTLGEGLHGYSTSVAAPTVTLNAANPAKIDVNVWLEGADDDCWNSCMNQNFVFDFTFTYTKATPAQGE